MTHEEYVALQTEPMTQERYEMLCAKYGFEATSKIAVYMNGNYDYENYGALPNRIYQLRAVYRLREREAAQTAADEAKRRERQLAAIAAHNRATAEQEAHDSGY